MRNLGLLQFFFLMLARKRSMIGQDFSRENLNCFGVRSVCAGSCFITAEMLFLYTFSQFFG